MSFLFISFWVIIFFFILVGFFSRFFLILFMALFKVCFFFRFGVCFRFFCRVVCGGVRVALGSALFVEEFSVCSLGFVVITFLFGSSRLSGVEEFMFFSFVGFFFFFFFCYFVSLCFFSRRCVLSPFFPGPTFFLSFFFLAAARSRPAVSMRSTPSALMTEAPSGCCRFRLFLI